MASQDSLSGSEAFDRLYSQHGSPIHRFLHLLVGNWSVADDLTQETFLDLWRRPASFDSERGSIRAYLLGIARNKAADWWRHNQHDEVSARQTSFSTDGLAIRDAMNQLPEDLRVVLWLREVEGYSYAELAELLKVPIGTVRSRLHSARQQLRNIWRKEAQ